MAGTGLPIPQDGVLAQGPGVIDGDRFSAASTWLQVARVGEKITDIGQREQHLVLAGKLAEAESETRQKRVELETKYQFDPDGFRTAWKGYTDGRLSAMTPGMVPHMKQDLLRQGDAAFAGISGQRVARDRGLADDSLVARQKLAEDDVLALAASEGPNSPKFIAAMQDWEGVSASRVSAGLVSEDTVKLQKEALLNRATGESIVQSAEKAYESKGLEGALAETQEALEKSGMRPSEQRKYLNTASAALRAREVWRREDVKGVMETAKPVLDLLERGTPGLDDEAHSIIDRLKELRAPLEAMRVERMLAKNTGYLMGYAQNGRPVGGNFVDRIVGAESGGNATATNPRSSATGAGQFIDSTWLNMVGKYRPDLMQGRTPAQVLALRNDPQLSREMTGAYAKENGEFLTNQGVPVRDGTLYLAHFAGPRGAAQLFKADPNTPVEQVLGEQAVAANPFLKGMTAAQVVAWADKKMGDASAASLDPAMLEGYRQSQQEIFSRRFPDMQKDAAFWGWTPENVSTIEAMWPFLSPTQQDQAAEALRTGAVSATFREWTPEAREAMIAKWKADAAEGNSAARAMLRDVEPGRQKLLDLEEKDPIARGQAGQWGRGPDAINWSAPPEQLAQDLRARAQDASVYAERLGRDAIPGLSQTEANGLAGLLRTGDALSVARTLSSLGSALPRETFALTMAMPQVKGAIEALTRSGDPQKMTAVFGALDQMQQVDPVNFGRVFAGDAEKRLALWQTWLAYKTPEEIADAVKAEADPIKAKAREEQRKQAETISSKFTDGQIMGMLDPNWYPFNQPAAPINPQIMARLRAETRLVFGDAYAITGDEAAATAMAATMLQKVWGASDFAGGALMRHPPEMRYHTIDGSHDWMMPQWEEFTKSRPAGEAKAYQLVPGRDADADVSAGRPPRYEVVYQRPDGVWSALRDETGAPLGFQFDEKRAESDQWSQPLSVLGRIRHNLSTWDNGQPLLNVFTGEPINAAR